MRLILPAITALTLAFAACSNSTIDPQPVPMTGAITPVGVSAGAKTEARIGPSGGELESSDGLLRLVIPAGALAAETTISVEPLTNTAPGGVGRAYRLLPTGLAFAAPVNLTIEDRLGLTLASLSIAYQGTDNIWQGIVATTSIHAPMTAKTTSITHFTDFALYQEWYLEPELATVNAGQMQPFIVFTTVLPSLDGRGELSPLAAPYVFGAAEVKEWAVESIRGGNQEFGTITSDGDSSKAMYTAPLVIPTTNPVAVDATVSRARIGKSDLQLRALVTIAGGATSVGRWQIRWIQTIENLCDPNGYEISWTTEDEGVDTITIVNIAGTPTVTGEASGVITDLSVMNLNECPAAERVELTITKQPVNSTPQLNVLATQTLYRMMVMSTGEYEEAEARDYSKNDTKREFPWKYHLGTGLITCWTMFDLPLRHGATFDTTYMQGTDQRLRNRGTLTKIN